MAREVKDEGREFLCPPRRCGRRGGRNVEKGGERETQPNEAARGLEFLGVYLPYRSATRTAIKERECEGRFYTVNGRLVVASSHRATNHALRSQEKLSSCSRSTVSRPTRYFCDASRRRNPDYRE